MAVADFAHHTWTRLTRQASRLSRVCGESNIWCEFCRQASTGQTARKKYQLMQEQQSSALLALLTPSNKTARHRKVQPSWVDTHTHTRDDAPHIDIWPSSFFSSLVAPTHPLNPCRPSTDLNEPGRAHTSVKPPRGASTNWLPPSKAGHQRCRGDKNGSLLGGRLALLRLVGTRHYATFTPLMPP